MSSVGTNYECYGALGVRPHMIKFTPSQLASNKISQNKTDHHLAVIVPLVSGSLIPGRVSLCPHMCELKAWLAAGQRHQARRQTSEVNLELFTSRKPLTISLHYH